MKIVKISKERKKYKEECPILLYEEGLYPCECGEENDELEKEYYSGNKLLLSEPINSLKTSYIVKAYKNTKTNECVVKFGDGTTSSSKCSKEDSFDKYIGVALAIAYYNFKSKKRFKLFVDSIYHENEKTKNIKTKKGTK